jgi:exodeoxyribonuclease VII large subunit
MVEPLVVRRRPVYSPSSLNRLIKATLEDVFPLIEVEGEIGSFRPAASGHWYFVLKDASAELKISMFRSRAVLCRIKPANGDKVLLRGRLTVYEPRGEYQLIAEFMEPAGMGEKLLALQRLREQLAAEGLLDPKSKRPLPRWPRSLWILTSAQGAALRDVLSVIARRFPLLPVGVWPVPVQGDDAARQMAEALRQIAALEQARPDVLLITRGGGSQEDLWCFNDEALARQVAAMPMPVLAAIGHEIDTTLVELVADLRAATPSAAAELLTPDAVALRQRLQQSQARVLRIARQQLETGSLRLDSLRARLDRLHPLHSLRGQQQQLEHTRQRLQSLLQGSVLAARNRMQLCAHALRRLHPQQPLHSARTRLQQRYWQLAQCLRSTSTAAQYRVSAVAQALHNLDPRSTLKHARGSVQGLLGRLDLSLQDGLGKHQQHLDALRRTLHAVSPQATLDRGYVMVFDRRSGVLLTRSEQCLDATALRLQMADGSVDVRVEGRSAAS